ncbi:unnamed protein product [Parajaminaea phylloscopi]
MPSVLAAVSLVLIAPFALFTLASLPLAFLCLIAYLEEHPAVARRWARFTCILTALLTYLVAYSEGLPLPLVLSATAAHISLFSLSSSTSPQRRSSALYISALAVLPLLSHWLLVRHLGALHSQWHVYRNAPRLPGDRLDWDIVAPHRAEYGVRDLVTLFAVVPAWPSVAMTAAALMASTGYGWATESLPLALASKLGFQGPSAAPSKSK